MPHRCLFPGTFDPFTIGHHAIVQRALDFMDEVVIAIGTHPEKNAYFSLDERLSQIKKIFSSESKVTVTSYNILTMDFAKQSGIPFILRGIRNINDFEYEKNLAEVNSKLSGIETIFLFSDPAYAFISSTLVRELLSYKKDISNLIPFIK